MQRPLPPTLTFLGAARTVTGSKFLVLVVEPESQSTLVILQVQMASPADEEALETILNTFIYFGF